MFKLFETEGKSKDFSHVQFPGINNKDKKTVSWNADEESDPSILGELESW